MSDKQRFQLFLHEFWQMTTAAARENGNTLSTECRQRIARSFWLDDLERYIRDELPNARGDRLETLQECLTVLSQSKNEVLSNAGCYKK